MCVCLRIRPGLGAQLQCEVVCISVARTHGVNESLSDGKRPAMEDSEWGFLIDLQFLHTHTHTNIIYLLYTLSCPVVAQWHTRSLWIVNMKIVMNSENRNLDAFQKVQISWCYRLLCPDEGAVGFGLFLFSLFHPTRSFSTDTWANPQKCSYAYVTIFIFYTVSHTWLRSAGLGLGFFRRPRWSSAQTWVMRRKWIMNDQMIAWRETFLSVQYLLKLSYFGFVKLRSVWIQKLDGKRTSCKETQHRVTHVSVFQMFTFPCSGTTYSESIRFWCHIHWEKQINEFFSLVFRIFNIDLISS